MTAARDVAKRLVLTAFVATVVVVLAAILGGLAPGGGATIAAGPDHQQWAADRIVEDRVATGGNADPQGDVGTVVFDRSHGNRFSSQGISSLVGAINEAGGEVEFTGITTGFGPSLERADVLVVIDPGTSYSDNAVDAIDEFLADGGKLVIFGEPNRKTLQASGLAVQLVTQESKTATLASEYGISFGTEYLYDMENNDGNFKAILSQSPDGTDAAAVDGVDRVSMYTATTVTANRGEVLLRTAPTAEQGDESTRRGFPVAVLANGGDVLAVGDKTFLSDQYDTVADNEVFVARIVEFMAGAGDGPADDEPPDEEPVGNTSSGQEALGPPALE